MLNIGTKNIDTIYFIVSSYKLRIKWFSKLLPSISYKFLFYLRTNYQYNYIMYPKS